MKNTKAPGTAKAADKSRGKACSTPDWPPAGLGTAVIFLLVLAVYFPALRGPFVWDDPVMLDENPLVNKQGGLLSVWFTGGFPLSSVAFWLQWLAWAKNPAGYHVVNVLLHGAGAVLLWRVLARLKVPGAWLAGVVFAVHPVCVASVAWISELKNTLSLPLYLLSILWYVRSEAQRTEERGERRHGGKYRLWYSLSLLAFLLACLAKTSGVMLPVMLLGCAWWQRGRVARRDLIRSLPFFVLALALGLMTVWFQSEQAIKGEIVQTEKFLGRLAGAGWAIWFYLGKALLPLNLSMIYPRWQINPASAASYLPLLLLAAMSFWLWRRRHAWGRHALFGLGAFAVMLWPVLGFIDMYYLVYSRVADQWQYLPLTGVVALVVGAGSWWLGERMDTAPNSQGRGRPHLAVRGYGAPVRVCAAAVLVLLLSILSRQHARIFASEESLWRDTLMQNPAAWCAANNLGNALLGQGRTGEAMALYLDALRINRNSADAHNNLGLALVKQGRIAEAAAHHAEAVRLQPKHSKYQFNLGIALARQGQLDEAIRHYTTALRLQPGYADAHNNLANVLWRQGRTQESLAHSLLALRFKPDLPEAHFNAARALVAEGKTAEAAAHFSMALKLRPGLVEAHSEFGLLLAQQGRLQEAAEQFGEIIRFEPTNSTAQGNLGNALAGLGKLDDAIAHYQQALRMDPKDSQTHNNLANALTEQGKLEEAIQHYTAALQLQQEDPEPQYNLGLALARLGRREEAMRHLGEALRLRPGYADAQRELDALAAQPAK